MVAEPVGDQRQHVLRHGHAKRAQQVFAFVFVQRHGTRRQWRQCARRGLWGIAQAVTLLQGVVVIREPAHRIGHPARRRLHGDVIRLDHVKGLRRG